MGCREYPESQNDWITDSIELLRLQRLRIDYVNMQMGTMSPVCPLLLLHFGNFSAL